LAIDEQVQQFVASAATPAQVWQRWPNVLPDGSEVPGAPPMASAGRLLVRDE
jgi:hypothetical protein